MDIRIRPATPRDYDDLCELFDIVDSLHREHLPYIFRKPDGPSREQSFIFEMITDENVGFFVAEIGDRLIASASAVIKEAPDFPLLVPRRFAIVDTLVVKPEYQSQGTGKLLMDTVHQWAIHEGATAVQLNVYDFNKQAIAFYEKLGYVTLSRTVIRIFDNE